MSTEHSNLLIDCLYTLQTLAANPAFADDAPEFNEGGCGYEAIQAIQAQLSELHQFKSSLISGITRVRGVERADS